LQSIITYPYLSASHIRLRGVLIVYSRAKKPTQTIPGQTPSQALVQVGLSCSVQNETI
jgi:hypothetical protein